MPVRTVFKCQPDGPGWVRFTGGAALVAFRTEARDALNDLLGWLAVMGWGGRTVEVESPGFPALDGTVATVPHRAPAC